MNIKLNPIVSLLKGNGKESNKMETIYAIDEEDDLEIL